MLKKQEIILIGPCGGGGVPKNGASAKNYHLVRYLREKHLHVTTVDTENWKKNPFILFSLLLHLLFSPRATFILAANSMSSYKVIRLFCLMPRRMHLVYWAIGGCVADWMKEGRVEKKPYSAVDLFIVEGENMQRTLAEIGFRNAIVVPNFKHIDYVPSGVSKPQERASLRFVFLSRIIPEKGCNTIINAVKLLNETHKDRFTVDFWGPFESRYEKEFLDQIETLDNVAYRGFLDLRDQKNYDVLAEYDAMLFPTYWPGEGFPGIVIDAFVAGLPVIATDWSQNADIIENGRTGVILKENSAEALHDAMLSFINDRAGIEEMRDNCLNMTRHYDIHNVVSDELIKQICR